MKRIEDIQEKIEDLLKNRRSEVEDMIKIEIDGKEFSIPQYMIQYAVKNMKMWEAESISDIKYNYSKITTKTPLDAKFIFSAMWVMLKMKMRVGSNRLLELTRTDPEIGKYTSTGDLRSGLNFNTVVLDNVYIGDLNFKYSKNKEICLLNIKDKNENNIPGVFEYKQGISSKYIKEKKLDDLLLITSNAEYSKAFDIVFTPITTPNPDIFSMQNSQKTLLVYSISNHEKDDQKKPIYDPGSLIFLP